MNKYGADWEPGTATFQYGNIQRAGTMWYHDHTLGMTRLNVYAGPAGFYLLRLGPSDLPAAVLPGPAPGVGSDPFGTYYEIPIAIQDRSFDDDGALFYPDSRFFFDNFPGPYIPDSDVSPIWNPEFFGNAIVVNGRTWPYLEVEQRRYRFRFLNGCNSRFLILKFDNGQTLTTGQVLQLRLVPPTSKDTSLDPADLVLPVFRPIGTPTNTRQVSLNEIASSYPGFDGPVEAMLGTLDANGEGHPLGWDDPITENPVLGSIETWEIYNFTEDAHPIHIHEVQFQVVDRQPVEEGEPRPPEAWETGFKDTVIAYPDEITRVKAHYDNPGLYVWHCHIVEHEDNEMMRPYFVGENPPSP